jgi:hypothetical protein
MVLRRFHLPSLIVCDLFIVSMWSYHRYDELTYNAFLTCFYMWVQHVIYPAMVEEEREDPIHDQNSDKPKRYVSFKDIHDCQNASRFLSPRR